MTTAGILTIIYFIFMVIIIAGTIAIVYFSIHKAVNKNKVYEQFAKQHGYEFDKAQGRLVYRENDKTSRTEMVITIGRNLNRFVREYTDFYNYPFGRGANIKVAYVISGTYEEVKFRAFTYIFTGSVIENSGRGGVFSIVMIQCKDEPKHELPDNVFYEKETLCSYEQGNLDVDTIHQRIGELINIAR